VGTGALPPAVKRPGRESDHSPPSSAEVPVPDLTIFAFDTGLDVLLLLDALF
jgi:hypothetical protein